MQLLPGPCMPAGRAGMQQGGRPDGLARKQLVAGVDRHVWDCWQRGQGRRP